MPRHWQKPIAWPLTALLEGFNPCLVGSYPIGLALPTSDLNYICQAQDCSLFRQQTTDAFGHLEGFDVETSFQPESAIATASFESPNGYAVTVTGYAMPVRESVPYVRMLVSARLLALAGKRALPELLKLKRNGLSTDAALGLFFGLDDALLPSRYRYLHTIDDEALKVFARLDRLQTGGLV